MSRVALSCVDRAQREVLTLELALYHAARDYPGGAAAIAATTGRNATTLQHKLSPTHPSHTVNVQEFGEILELTKDRRILDAVHGLVGDTIWQELAEAYTCAAAWHCSAMSDCCALPSCWSCRSGPQSLPHGSGR